MAETGLTDWKEAGKSWKKLSGDEKRQFKAKAVETNEKWDDAGNLNPQEKEQRACEIMSEIAQKVRAITEITCYCHLATVHILIFLLFGVISEYVNSYIPSDIHEEH